MFLLLKLNAGRDYFSMETRPQRGLYLRKMDLLVNCLTLIRLGFLVSLRLEGGGGVAIQRTSPVTFLQLRVLK